MRDTGPRWVKRLLCRTLATILALAYLLPGVSASPRPQETAGGLFVDAALQGALNEAGDPTVLRSRPVRVRFDLLHSAGGVAPALPLNLFPDASFTGLLDRVEANSLGGLTWIGHLAGIAHSQVTLVIGGGRMVGDISLPGVIYQVRGLRDGLHVIRQIDQSAFPPSLEPLAVEVPDGAKGVAGFAPTADDGSIIDVLVVYSPEARAAEGGTSAMQALVELAVAETNVSYANSGVAQRVNLAHTAEISGAANDFALDLPRLRATSDGYMDSVHDLRDTYSADAVALIIEDPTYCGLAYQMSSVSPAFASSAFVVVHRTCAAGYYSLAHELGHTMGGRHDWYVDEGITPYPHSHGYVNVTDRWRTMMAYDDKCSDSGTSCTKLQYWSNPEVTFGGDPMGVPEGTNTSCTEGNLGNPPCDADNRKTLNKTASTVAAFRSRLNTWTGAASTLWNTADNWHRDLAPLHAVPLQNNDVLIPASPTGGRFPVVDGDARCWDLTVENGAQLSMSGHSLEVYGDWAVQGSGVFSATGGTVVFRGKWAQTIAAVGGAGDGFYNLQIGDGTSGQVVTATTGLDVDGDLDVMADASLVVGGQTLRVAGNWSERGAGFSPGTGTVILDGANQTVRKQGAGKVYLLGPQGFEGAFPPAGWSRQDNAGYGDWQRSDAFGATNRTAGLGYSAASRGTSQTNPTDLDNELRSPAIDIPADGAWLDYKSNFQDYLGNGDAWLDVSTDGGESWHNLTHWTEDHGPTQEQVDLSAYAGQTIQLRWRFVAAAGDAWYWQIDDVEVYALSWNGTLAFHNLTVDSWESGATFLGDVAVGDDLVIGSGATMEMDIHKVIALGGSFANAGTLSNNETRVVTSGSDPQLYLDGLARGAAQVTYVGGDVPGATTTTMRIGTTIPGNAFDAGCSAGLDTVKRFYNLVAEDNDGLSVTLRLYYDDAELNGNVEAELEIWHCESGSWVNEGGTVYTTEDYVEATVTSFSPFVLADSAPVGTPQPPTLLSPANGTVISDTTATLIWASSDGASGYLLDWNGAVEDLGDVTQHTTSILADGTYTWTVAAYDTLAHTSPYTDVWSLAVDATPPQPPALLNPVNGTVLSDTTPTLSWAASNGASGYLLDWNGAIEDLGDVTQHTTSILVDGTYTWTVAAYDDLGHTSSYTDVWSLAVDATPPQPPALLSPANGTVLSDTTPALTWAVSDGASGYLLDWNGAIEDLGDVTQHTTSVLADGTYTWTVAAYDALDNVSPFTDTWSLTVDATPPQPPVMLSLADGAVISDTTPTLSWAASGGASGYLLDWNGAIEDLGNVTQHTTSILADGTYTWTVASYDDVGNTSPFTETWSLTVDATPPQPPVLLSPANGALISDTTPALSWAASDGAAGYLLDWNGTIKDLGDVTQHTTSILTNGTYTWTVAAYDALGNASSFADTWWFALDAGDERSFGVYLPMVVCQGAEQRAPFAVREAYLGR